MAVSTTSYFSNSIVGQPQVGADIDIFDTASSPKYAVGFGFQRADGAKFRYVHFGAISNRGTLVATDRSESSLSKIENVGALVANITKRANETINPNAIGARYMQLVISATAQQFEGGYLTFTTGTGVGFTYRIKGHTVTTDANPVTGNIYLDLHDSIVVALDSNSDIAIAGNPYANLESATTTDELPVGVTITNNTATNYGWVQTHGIVGVLQDATIGTQGDPVSISSATAGAIQAAEAESNTNLLVYPVVGYMVEPGSSADYSLVYLTLE